jgi:acyl carrier protein
MKDEILAMIIDKLVSLNKTEASMYNAGTRFVEDLNIKSMDIVKIIGVLEDEYGLDINFMEFRRKPTLGEAAEYVAALAE